MIGYRPPHTGAAKIAQLRAEVEAHNEALLDEWLATQAAKIAAQPFAHPIPAIRAWMLSPSGFLQAVASNFKYEGPVTRNAGAPEFRDTRGFWAVKPKYIDIIDSYNPDVVGTVELSGRVIEHDMGWRAEVCTIQALYLLPKARNADARALEDRYQCDVHFLDSIYQVTGRLLR